MVPPKKAWNIRNEYFTEMCLENPGEKYYIICIYAEATKNGTGKLVVRLQS